MKLLSEEICHSIWTTIHIYGYVYGRPNLCNYEIGTMVEDKTWSILHDKLYRQVRKPIQGTLKDEAN